MAPGRQRAYLLHFAAPKQAKTREARIEKCMPRIRNDPGLTE
ncbi:YdeI/OmpD-associated family protein [Pedobacter sp. N36a]|nr:YdeI/OmpD-associated family protein [Pedobacter sp. N36a]